MRDLSFHCARYSGKGSKAKTTECCFWRSETTQSKECGELSASRRRQTTMRRWRVAKPRKSLLLRQNKKDTNRCPFCFYPSRRLGISSPREVRCISSAPLGLYIITRQRVSFLQLDDIRCFASMIYRNKLRMIYKAYALIMEVRLFFNLVRRAFTALAT